MDWNAGASVTAAANRTSSTAPPANVRRPICLLPRFPLDCGLNMLKRPTLPSLCLLTIVLMGGLPLAGCKKGNSEQINFQMGEVVIATPMLYNVVQTVWRTQLGNL